MAHHSDDLLLTAFAAAESLIPAYLHVQSRRAGKIKGETTAPGHVDEIEVTGWKWGAQAGGAMNGTASMGRSPCTYRVLTIYKRIDTATTALLWALARNDELREVRLTRRRPVSSDGVQEDVFTLTLCDARVVAVDQGRAADSSDREIVSFESKIVQMHYQSGKPTKPVVAQRLPAPPPAQKASAPALGMGAPGGQVASDADIGRGLGSAALWAAGKIDQFQRTELGRNLQALPPEGAAAGGLKAGLLLVGRLAKAGDAAKGATAVAETAFKTTHYASRLEAAGVNVARAETAVAKEVNAMRGSLAANADVVGRLTVDGIKLEYRARLLPSGTVTVGTLFPVK